LESWRIEYYRGRDGADLDSNIAPFFLSKSPPFPHLSHTLPSLYTSPHSSSRTTKPHLYIYLVSLSHQTQLPLSILLCPSSPTLCHLPLTLFWFVAQRDRDVYLKVIIHVRTLRGGGFIQLCCISRQEYRGM